METKISVRIECNSEVKYRLYIDEFLLTERLHRFSFINEETVLDLQQGSHQLTLEWLEDPGDHSVRFMVNGTSVSAYKDDLKLCAVFKIDK